LVQVVEIIAVNLKRVTAIQLYGTIVMFFKIITFRLVFKTKISYEIKIKMIDLQT